MVAGKSAPKNKCTKGNTIMKLWPFSKTPAPVKTKGAVYPSTAFMGTGNAVFSERNIAVFSKEGYVQNAVAFRCIQMIARSASSIDLQVMRSKGDATEVLNDHPLMALLDRPNPSCGGAAFFEAMLSLRLITGNCYVMRNPDDVAGGEPRELWLLHPERMTIKSGTMGLPSAYEYDKGHGDKRSFAVDQLTGASAVLHMREFNPINDWYGLSPMEAAAYSVDTMNSAMKWNKALLDNAARPSGALAAKNTDGTNAELSSEQVARLREQIDYMFSGARNAGRPLLLEGGLTWQEMSHNPKDMDFLNNLMTAARFVATAFGVPPQLVNIIGESTYSNYKEAKEAFWQDTVIPLLDTTLDELNHWLSPLYGDDIWIGYDADTIPAFEEKRASKFERISNTPIMTINEKRRALGIGDTIAGGDELFVASGMVPIGLLGDDEVSGA